MENLTFDLLNQAWNALRMSNTREMAEQIPSLQNPRALVLTRVSETPFVLLVNFRGFDNALTDPDRGIPMAKRFLINWIKQFGQAQIQRGDEDSLLVRITKESPNPIAEPAPVQVESVRSGPLAHIANVRTRHD